MFLRVDQKQAGPDAIGILIPHGAKTLVIVRPRSLAWDLLPARWDGQSDHPPEFAVFTRDEAAGVARDLVRALDAAVATGVNPVQTFGDADRARLQIWVRTAPFVWIVCRRTPGQAYQPMIFTSPDEAIREAERLTCLVWPAGGTQEYYFNTQNLS